MENIDEGFIDFLKRIWYSLVGKPSSDDRSAGDSDEKPDANIQHDDFDDRVEKRKKSKDGYSGIEDIDPDDVNLKKTLAKIFIRGVRLHQEATKFGVKDEDLVKVLGGVWHGQISLSQFFKLRQSGIIDRIYSRVRERVRYQRKKQGVWNESAKD